MRFSVVRFARKIAPLTLKHSNLPESYVRECTELIEYKAPNVPSHRKVTIRKHKEYYDMYRPWTKMFQMSNYPIEKQAKVWVEPVKEWKYFRGDRVEVLTGKDKGKQGIITYIIQERNWVIVRGLNVVIQKMYKNLPPVLREAPYLIDRQVSLVDPVDLAPTKVEWRFDEDGNRVRVSVRTGRILDIPPMEEETFDYKMRSAYTEQKKDTVNADLSQVTFVPALKTFEMDIMDEYNIKEDRIPGKTYWY